MSALTDDRNTPMRDGAVLSIPAAGDKMFFVGAIVAITMQGLAVPASIRIGLRGMGRCESNMDTNGSEDNACVVAIRKGIFRYDNDGGSIYRAHIGNDCYMVDDQTVSISDGADKGESRGIAGKIFDVDIDGVWVKFN